MYEEFLQAKKEDDITFWFDMKKEKFLHNVDTFYYSVMLTQDFSHESEDPVVLRLRNYFDNQLVNKAVMNGRIPFHLDNVELVLNIRYGVFAGIYKYCIECPDYFDIFIAPFTPNMDTGQIVVQLRSYYLWMYGVTYCFEQSFKVVQALCSHFDLDIYHVQENRIDYCWHSNYLMNPEQFFSIEHYAVMRRSRLKPQATFHVEFYGNEKTEIDYIREGKRGGKCFLRIYLKSKEVVEQGYKAFFLQLWLFNGLINRYDFYCYEKCYAKRNWHYLDYARLEWYIEYGADDELKKECQQIVQRKIEKNYDDLHAFADCLTPKVTLVMNVEYQTMRKSTKTYELLKLRDNSKYGVCKRVYDYFDNRKLITEYLTRDTFSLTEPNGDSNKSRRDFCGFWKALRSCKMVDVKPVPNDIKLHRIYNRKLNKQVLKNRILSQAVTYGFYTKGMNNDNIIDDCVQVLCYLNDNDIQHMKNYKNKKSRQFNDQELAGVVEGYNNLIYRIVDDNGIVYDKYNLDKFISQVKYNKGEVYNDGNNT